MQEEVENRTVNLAISTTKLTFRTIVNGYNAWKRHHQAKVAQKTAQLPVGKQSIKELIGQNQGVSSIPIEKTDLKGFEQVARKYGVDYAITKDQNVMPPKYTVFFKAKDADMTGNDHALEEADPLELAEIKRRWEPYINQLPNYAYLCKDLLNGKM